MRILKKIIAPVLAIAVFMSFSGCATRERVDLHAFVQACTDCGLTVQYTDAATTGEEGLTEYVVATSDNASAELLSYEDEASANKLYAEAVSASTNENVTVEKKIDSAGYKKYFVSNGDTYTAIVLVGSTLVYGKQDTNNDIIRNLMKEINYN